MSTLRTGVRWGALGAGLLACLAGTPSALGQNALGDGQVLDRNLRQGSGGRNSAVRDLNAMIRFNNSVVTGNAFGGKSFRGDTGYRATDDFRGALGSDALFNFRRDAAPSAVPVIAGIRGTDALRYQFALTTGQNPPLSVGAVPDFSEGLRRGGNPTHPGVITSVEQRVGGSTLSSSLRSTADFSTQQTLRPTVLGYRKLEDGRESMLTASPLLGVTEFTTGQAVGTTAGATPRATPGLTGVEAVPSNVFTPTAVTSASTQLNTRVDVPAIVDRTFKRAMDQAKERPAPRDTTEPIRDPNLEPLVPERESAALTPQQVSERELERIRKYLGTPESLPVPGEEGTEDGDEAAPSQPSTLEELISPATGKINAEVLRALQMTRPVVGTLTPDEEASVPNNYAVHMSRGEEALKEGRFFDAEDAFVRALALQPGDPLASVGRVHAELGAGLFLSAAANLKTLFTDRPTMIGTRYTGELVPGPKRAESLARQLRSVIGTPTSAMGREAGMLLAYLGYQTNNPEQVKEGLKEMAERTYPDQKSDVLLLGLLQRVWVEGKEPVPSAEAPATPDQPPSPAPTPAPGESADGNK